VDLCIDMIFANSDTTELTHNVECPPNYGFQGKGKSRIGSHIVNIEQQCIGNAESRRDRILFFLET